MTPRPSAAPIEPLADGADPAQDASAFKRVIALAIDGPHPAASRTGGRHRSAPEFRVDVEGFYRRLRQGRVGKDAEGNPVLGQTWVHTHQRWRGRPERPQVANRIMVKDPVRPAIDIADELATDEGATVRFTI